MMHIIILGFPNHHTGPCSGNLKRLGSRETPLAHAHCAYFPVLQSCATASALLTLCTLIYIYINDTKGHVCEQITLHLTLFRPVFSAVLLRRLLIPRVNEAVVVEAI